MTIRTDGAAFRRGRRWPRREIDRQPRRRMNKNVQRNESLSSSRRVCARAAGCSGGRTVGECARVSWSAAAAECANASASVVTQVPRVSSEQTPLRTQQHCRGRGRSFGAHGRGAGQVACVRGARGTYTQTPPTNPDARTARRVLPSAHANLRLCRRRRRHRRLSISLDWFASVTWPNALRRTRVYARARYAGYHPRDRSTPRGRVSPARAPLQNLLLSLPLFFTIIVIIILYYNHRYFFSTPRRPPTRCLHGCRARRVCIFVYPRPSCRTPNARTGGTLRRRRALVLILKRNAGARLMSPYENTVFVRSVPRPKAAWNRVPFYFSFLFFFWFTKTRAYVWRSSDRSRRFAAPKGLVYLRSHERFAPHSEF